MKLNPDCIRDILIYCEDECTIKKGVQIKQVDSITINKNTYQWDVLLYHLRQCKMNGYLHDPCEDTLGDFFVEDLTPKAHEFLANIRSDTVWKNVKDVVGQIGVKSLDGISQIASKVVSEIICSYLRANGTIF